MKNLMQTRPIQEKDVRTCYKCGEPVIKFTSKLGRNYYSTVQQEGSVLCVIVKNGVVVEHKHA